MNRGAHHDEANTTNGAVRVATRPTATGGERASCIHSTCGRRPAVWRQVDICERKSGRRSAIADDCTADSPTHTPRPAELSTLRRSRAQRQRDFLAAFKDRGIVRDAAAEAGIDRSAHYRWLSEEEGYRTAFAQAEEDACDLLETEARRRAVDGWAEPVSARAREPMLASRSSDTSGGIATGC